jgi:hypothetical protein
VDGVTGTNSDPDPLADAEGTSTTVQDTTQTAQTTQGAAGAVTGGNAGSGTAGASQQGAVTQSGASHPTSDAVVNQVLGKDQGMLPVVKGGAGAGLR